LETPFFPGLFLAGPFALAAFLVAIALPSGVILA
jgi:hypothetical protein